MTEIFLRSYSFARSSHFLTYVAAGALILFSLAAFLDRHFIGNTTDLFWDMPVYVAAAEAHFRNLNPYDPSVMQSLGVSSYLNFTSPPLVDDLFRLVGLSPLRLVFLPFLILLHLVAVVLLPLIESFLFFGRRPFHIVLSYAAFLSLFCMGGLGAVGSGNNGVFLYFLIIAAAVPGFRRSNWLPLHGVLIVATAFKPFYAAFWILPVLSHGFSKRQFVASIAAFILACTTYLAYYFLYPDLIVAWLASLRAQTLLTITDSGANVYGAIRTVLGPDRPLWLALVPQFSFAAILLTLAWTLPIRGPVRWAFLLVIAVFANPRVMAYDLAPVAIPFAFLVAAILPGHLDRDVRLATATTGLTILHLLTYRSVDLIAASILFPFTALLVLGSVAFVAHRAHGFGSGFPAFERTASS